MPDTTPWANRSVLVTGGTGFVGSWLVKALLASGAHVVTLVQDSDPRSELCRSGDVNRVSVVYGGVADQAAVERALLAHEVDTVFHLGAQTIVGIGASAPFLTFEANIRGTYTLLEVIRRHLSQVARIVVASSDKAYGPQVELPYTEDAPLMARAPYDVSKSCADLLAQSYHLTYGLPVVIARCGNILGGGDLNWSRLVPGTIRSLHAGVAPVIRSNGRAVRDYLYVKDAVDGYLTLAEAATDPQHRGQAYNLSAESPKSVLDMVGMISGLMGRDDLPPRILGTARHETERQFLSARKARERLGWRVAHDLTQALTETISWYRCHLDGAAC